MKRLMGFVLMTLLMLLPALVVANAGTFTTIDVPDSLQTNPIAINPAGTITGSYHDASFIPHGFLRAPDGTFTTIDVPGAAGQGTIVTGINPAGTITGFYDDVNFVARGFLRASNGTFTTFDAPPGSLSLQPLDINPARAITGDYVDANFVGHGFLWIP